MQFIQALTANICVHCVRRAYLHQRGQIARNMSMMLSATSSADPPARRSSSRLSSIICTDCHALQLQLNTTIQYKTASLLSHIPALDLVAHVPHRLSSTSGLSMHQAWSLKAVHGIMNIVNDACFECPGKPHQPLAVLAWRRPSCPWFSVRSVRRLLRISCKNHALQLHSQNPEPNIIGGQFPRFRHPRDLPCDPPHISPLVYTSRCYWD